MQKLGKVAASFPIHCGCIELQVLGPEPDLRSPVTQLFTACVSQRRWLYAIGQKQASSRTSAMTRDTNCLCGIQMKLICETKKGKNTLAQKPQQLSY
jgi:hypothetical protein